MEERIIEKSKAKTLGIALGIPFLVGCVLSVLLMGDLGLGGALLLFLGVFGILGGLLFLISGGRKIFDGKPGIVFNSEGFTDNSNGLSPGFVPWSEVTDIGAYTPRQGADSVLVFVKDNEKYLETGSSMAKMTKKANAKLVGTPILVGSTGLKISFEDLLAVFKGYLALAQAEAAEQVEIAAQAEPAAE